MVKCSVFSCSNDSSKNKKQPGLTFHSFPADAICYIKWVKLIRELGNDKSWKPSKKSMICSQHFKDEDFFLRKTGHKKLRKYAVPLKFVHGESDVANIEIISRQPVNCKSEFYKPLDWDSSVVRPERSNLGHSLNDSASSSDSTQDDMSDLIQFPKRHKADHNTQVCIVCLTSDCKMFPMEGAVQEAFRMLMNDNLLATSAHVCWECMARLRCAARLQQKARTAQELLTHLNLRIENIDPKTLSSIDRSELGLCSNLASVPTQIMDTPPQTCIEIKKESTKNEEDSLSSNDMFNDVPLCDIFTDNNISEDIISDGVVKNEPFKSSTEDVEFDAPVISLDVGKRNKVKGGSKRKETRPGTNRSPSKYRSKAYKDRLSELDRVISANFTIRKLSQEEQIEEFNSKKDNPRYLMLPYKCGFCYLGFSSESKYSNHMMKHDKERGDFECNICKIRLPMKYHLSDHIKRSHLEVYKCLTCEMMTKNRSVAFSHLKAHSGKLLKCPVCSEQFTHRSTYLTHRRLKHVSEHVCEQCGYTFLSERGKEMHKNKMHSGESKTILGI